MMRLSTCIRFALLVMSMTTMTMTQTAVAQDVSGRPPIGPLERVDPRIWDLQFTCSMLLPVEDRADGVVFWIQKTPIYFPMIFQGTYNRIDPGSLSASMTLAGRKIDSPATELSHGHAWNTSRGTIWIEPFKGNSMKWSMNMKQMCWSSRIDDREAGRLPWPQQWPEQVRKGLQQETLIESDDPIFKEFVTRTAGDQLRRVPPYYAAKDLIRAALKEIDSVNGTGNFGGEEGAIQGMDLQGALATARSRRGSPHDLVCLSVAVLRAAGIPARPVIGIRKDDQQRRKTNLVSWGEFYIHGAGWIPFDPVAVRNKVPRNRPVEQAWNGLGTIDSLNHRVPLCYRYIPEVGNGGPNYPMVWSWTANNVQNAAFYSTVALQMINRGRGPGS